MSTRPSFLAMHLGQRVSSIKLKSYGTISSGATNLNSSSIAVVDIGYVLSSNG